MKIKEGYLLRQIAGKWIVVPFGERVVEFNGIISLNETGAFIWKKIEKGNTKEEIVESILSEFDTEYESVSKDYDEFIELLKSNGVLEN